MAAKKDVSITFKTDEDTARRVDKVVLNARMEKSVVLRAALIFGLPAVESDAKFYVGMLAFKEAQDQ